MIDIDDDSEIVFRIVRQLVKNVADFIDSYKLFGENDQCSLIRHRHLFSDPWKLSNESPPEIVQVIDRDDWLNTSWRDAKRNLIEARLHDLQVSRELERENMHLYLSEMLIAAVEQMKWTSAISRSMAHEEYLQYSECSLPSTSSSSPFPTSTSNNHYASLSDLERNSSKSPEAIASALLRHFSTRKQRRTSDEMDWLVSYADAPQLLLPMPTGVLVPSDEICASADNDRIVHLRGTFDWAPPRKQWILKLHPTPTKCDFIMHTCTCFIMLISRLHSMLEKQKFRCAGCGMKLESRIYARRVRYCDYFGRVFCQCCHRGAKTRVPARILHQWNFKTYPVCDLAFRFLCESNGQPIFNLPAIVPDMYGRIRSLKSLRDQRTKLVHMWEYVRTCKWAAELVTKDGNLKTRFASLPAHWLNSVDVFSLADLELVPSGRLLSLIQPILQIGAFHIQACEHCKAQAFVCEWCQNEDDLLFPFQLDKVHRCDSCGSLTHLKCLSKNLNCTCPKCARLERRRLHLTQISVARLAIDSEIEG